MIFKLEILITVVSIKQIVLYVYCLDFEVLYYWMISHINIPPGIDETIVTIGLKVGG